MESLLASLGNSGENGMDISKLMTMAASMASSLSSEMDTDEKNDIKNMSSEDQVKKVTEKVMNMMGSFNLEDPPQIENVKTDDIHVSADVTVSDLIKGLSNKKFKYKRHVKGKKELVKEKIFLNTDPMTLEKVIFFKNKGDNNEGDLYVSLNVKSTSSLSLDNKNNLIVRHIELPKVVKSTIIVNDLDIILCPSEVVNMSFRLENKGMILPDGTTTDIIVNCTEI
jgi:DnaJ-class molecular chaperone